MEIKADETLFNKIKAFQHTVQNMAAAVQNDMVIDPEELKTVLYNIERNVEVFQELAGELKDYLVKDATQDPDFMVQLITEVVVNHQFTYGDGRVAKIQYKKAFGHKNGSTEMRACHFADTHADRDPQGQRVYKTALQLIVERIQ